MTRGMDFRGNTSSAVAKLLFSERETDTSSDVSPSGISNDFSVVVDLVEGASVIPVEPMML